MPTPDQNRRNVARHLAKTSVFTFELCMQLLEEYGDDVKQVRAEMDRRVIMGQRLG